MQLLVWTNYCALHCLFAFRPTAKTNYGAKRRQTLLQPDKMAQNNNNQQQQPLPQPDYLCYISQISCRCRVCQISERATPGRCDFVANPTSVVITPSSIIGQRHTFDATAFRGAQLQRMHFRYAATTASIMREFPESAAISPKFPSEWCDFVCSGSRPSTVAADSLQSANQWRSGGVQASFSRFHWSNVAMKALQVCGGECVSEWRVNEWVLSEWKKILHYYRFNSCNCSFIYAE